MQIVIELSEENKNLIDRLVYSGQTYLLPTGLVEHLVKKVAIGKVLPKGHGKLIDADALEKKMCDREEELGDDRALWESSAVSVALDMFAPTIIEADKE